MTYRQCIICGASFPRNGKVVMCSDACKAVRKLQYQASKRAKTCKPKVERGCAQCGAIVVTGKSQKRYCSAACKDQARGCVLRNGKPKRQLYPGRTKAEERKAYRQRHGDAIRARDRAKYKATYIPNPRPIKEHDPLAAVFHGQAFLTYLVCKSLVKRIAALESESARPTPAEIFRARYRTDPSFRQAQIQRTKTQKLKRKANILAPLTAKQTRALYAERSTCLYCGCALTEDQKVLEHMDPLSKGGAHCASNLNVACQRCNTRKAAKLFIRWLDEVKPERRQLIERTYKAKHGASVEQPSLQLFIKR